MRKEKFIVDNYYHIYNRGNRKAEIVRATADKWRLMQALRFFNDSHSSTHILRQISLAAPGAAKLQEAESVFETGWPKDWPEKDQLVRILCYSLMPNHFHLLLKEIRDGGISKFMHKLDMGYANFFNIKYHEVGRIFQGPYKAKLVNEETYLKYLAFYIQVINVLELYPGGFERALESFNKAIEFLNGYPFSSHPDYADLRNSLIIDKDVLGDIFPIADDYKKFIREMIIARDYKEILQDLTLD